MNNSSESLMKKFVEYALLHGSATESGDHVSANRAFDRLEKLTQVIQVAGLDKDIFGTLLDHKNESVKAFAAYRYLKFDPQRSVAALERVAQSPGLVGFSAMQLLKKVRLDI